LLILSIFPASPAARQPADLSPDREVFSVAFSSDGRTVAALGKGHWFTLWDVASGREQKAVRLGLGDDEKPQSVGLNREGKPFVLLYKYKNYAFRDACVWDMTTGKKSPEMKIQYGVMTVCPKGEWFADGPTLLEVVTGKRVKNFKIPNGWITQVQFSPDGKRLAYWLTDGLAQNFSMIYLLDIASGKEVLSVGEKEWKELGFRFFSPPIFSPDSKLIAFQERSTAPVQLRDVATGKGLARMANTDLEDMLGFAGGGKTLVTWQRFAYRAQTIEESRDPKRRINKLHLYDTGSGKAVRSLFLQEPVLSLSLSPDGRNLAVVRGRGIDFHKLGD
jgi:WD40 repeat protein